MKNAQQSNHKRKGRKVSQPAIEMFPPGGGGKSWDFSSPEAPITCSSFADPYNFIRIKDLKKFVTDPGPDPGKTIWIRTKMDSVTGKFKKNYKNAHFPYRFIMCL